MRVSLPALETLEQRRSTERRSQRGPTTVRSVSYRHGKPFLLPAIALHGRDAPWRHAGILLRNLSGTTRHTAAPH